MEPKWNVKLMEDTYNSPSYCINGTKVECKDRIQALGDLSPCCINGTKVECKGRLAAPR